METQKSTTKGLAIASMALGIFSIISAQGGLIGIAAAVLALIFAQKVKQAGEECQFSTVGRITAFVGIGLRIANAIASVIAVIGVICFYVFFIGLFLLIGLVGEANNEFVYEFEHFVSSVSFLLP